MPALLQSRDPEFALLSLACILLDPAPLEPCIACPETSSANPLLYSLLLMHVTFACCSWSSPAIQLRRCCFVLYILWNRSGTCDTGSCKVLEYMCLNTARCRHIPQMAAAAIFDFPLPGGCRTQRDVQCGMPPALTLWLSPDSLCPGCKVQRKVSRNQGSRWGVVPPYQLP